MNPSSRNRNPRQGKQASARKPLAQLVAMAGVGVVLGVGLYAFLPNLFHSLPERQAGSAAVEVTKPGSMPNRDSASSQPATNASNGVQPANPAPQDADDKSLVLVERGTALMNQGKLNEAVEAFQAAIKISPEAEDTHYNLGIALGRLGRAEEAARAYREALRIFPDYAEAHNNLGNLLKDQGKLDEAIEHFTAALKIIPDHASAHNNLGVALAREGKLNEATLHFTKAVQFQPDYAEAHYNLGSSYMAHGRLDEAAAEYKTTLRLQPDFQPAVRGLLNVQQKRSLLRNTP
jgi:Tfp pilus assembly protein PilF